MVARYLSYEAKRARWSRRQRPQRLWRYGIKDCWSVLGVVYLSFIQLTFRVDLSIPPANVNCVSRGSFSLASDSNSVLHRTLTPLPWRLAKKRPSLSPMILELKVFKVYSSLFLGSPVPYSVLNIYIYISVQK